MIAVPRGFRQSTAGLIVPEEVSRKREVWTYQEWRDLDRVSKRFEARGISLYLKCDAPTCETTKITRLTRPDGGVTLRCACTDREFTKV